MIAGEGLKVTVRPVRAEDHAGLVDVWTCPGVVRNTLRLPFGAPDLWDRWKRLLAAANLGSGVWVAEVDRQTVGVIVLTCGVDLRSHSARLGIEVHDDCQGRGVGHELMSAAVDHAESQLHIRRIELRVFAVNEPAIALYEKFEFEIEGTHLSFGFREGQFVDVYSMARVTA